MVDTLMVGDPPYSWWTLVVGDRPTHGGHSDGGRPALLMVDTLMVGDSHSSYARTKNV